jgi:hypothetical protein
MDTMQILPEGFKNEICAIFDLKNQLADVTRDSVKLRNEKGVYLVFYYVSREKSPWFGGYAYVDIMQKNVTEKFLEITLDAYKNNSGNEFGKAIPGSFQDEASISHVWDSRIIPYTPALFGEFKTKWGYELKEKLPMLYKDTLDFRKVRHDYYSTLLDLFIENWAIPYKAYCKKNNLIFTGHYWEHEWPRPMNGPDNMAIDGYNDMPGIDLLMNHWYNGRGGQFGVERSIREVRSIANQMGQKRILSETYGASGWDITFADQKRIVDWECVLGINFVNQHLQYMTIAGARKRDHPQSFSYHEPWWEDYTVMGDYIGRLSLFASVGEQINTTLIIEPTTTGWMYCNANNLLNGEDMIDSIASVTHKFIRKLETMQIEYDLASEHTMRNFGEVKGNEVKLVNRNYRSVVLPPFTETIDASTVKLLELYLRHKGKIISFVEPPKYVDGVESDLVRKLADTYKEQWIKADISNLNIFNKENPSEISFSNIENAGLLYHQHRKLKDAELILLVNTNESSPSQGQFTINGGSVEGWNMMTGEIEKYPFATANKNISVDFDIPAKGSLLLCVKQEKATTIAKENNTHEIIKPADRLSIIRSSPNVLTIDYCDLRLGGKTEKDLYYYQAQKKAYQHNGMKGNPWDSGVQFKSETLDADTFKSGGLEADFWFIVEKGTRAEGMEAVVERPAIFKVYINDIAVEAKPGAWWLDKDFGVYDIANYVKSGKNKITVKVSPFSVFAELEPIYICGDFGVKPVSKGFSICPANKLKQGDWVEQDLPFYSNGVDYIHNYNIENVNGKYVLMLDKWIGTVAEVYVNDIKTGVVFTPPYKLDITKSLRSGNNKVAVRIIGSLRNTLGPFHVGRTDGSAWPAMFQQGNQKGYPAGKEYNMLPYGMMTEFELIKR